MPTLQQISRHPARSRRNFPLEFGWQSRTRPASKGIGLVVADVTDRFAQVHRLHAFDGVMPPVAVALLPIQRRTPLIGSNAVPSVRKPQAGCAVTVVTHEFQILAVGHQAGGQAKSFEINLVTWSLVVERKALTCKPDAVDAFGEAAPLPGRDRRPSRVVTLLG